MADARAINLTNDLKKNCKNFMSIYYMLEQSVQQWDDLGLSGNVTDSDLEGTGVSATELTSAITSLNAVRTTLISDNNSDNLNKIILS